MELLLCFACTLALAACKHEPLPKLMQVPDFRFTNQDGRPFGSSELNGHVWIAGFMFTSCPDVCPILTEKLRGLQRRVQTKAKSVQFVSISVDPTTDTPARLTAYANQHHADTRSWNFLTGPQEALAQVIVEGFKQRLEQPKDNPLGILHGTHFVLVDPRGMVRGFYRTDLDGMRALARDAVLLSEDTPPAKP